MPSGDYSAEFKQRFADGYADGATIAMLQHEFGLAKSPRREYPLSALLEPIGMPRSAYCRHEAGPPSGRRATERPAIAGICEKSRFGYGCRRVADTLRKAAGIRIADKTAHKAVREEGPLPRARRRRRRRFRMGRAGKSPRTCRPATSGRNPTAKPAADVAEFRVGGAKPRLSPAVDPCSDEVVAYSISRSPSMETVPEMPAGLEGGPDGGDAPLPHSDMGRQHRMCPPAGSRSSGRGSPGPCPAKEAASTTRRPRTSSRWPRPSLAAIGRDGPDVFEGDPEKHIDRYSNVRIKRRLDGSGPVECRLGRAA